IELQGHRAVVAEHGQPVGRGVEARCASLAASLRFRISTASPALVKWKIVPAKWKPSSSWIVPAPPKPACSLLSTEPANSTRLLPPKVIGPVPAALVSGTWNTRLPPPMLTCWADREPPLTVVLPAVWLKVYPLLTERVPPNPKLPIVSVPVLLTPAAVTVPPLS